jgi:hypothetical protein
MKYSFGAMNWLNWLMVSFTSCSTDNTGLRSDIALQQVALLFSEKQLNRFNLLRFDPQE